MEHGEPCHRGSQTQFIVNLCCWISVSCFFGHSSPLCSLFLFPTSVSCMISGVWTTGRMTCAGGGDLYAMLLAPPTRMWLSNLSRNTVSHDTSLHLSLIYSAQICLRDIILKWCVSRPYTYPNTEHYFCQGIKYYVLLIELFIKLYFILLIKYIYIIYFYYIYSFIYMETSFFHRIAWYKLTIAS